MATFTIFGDASDGLLQSANAAYATARTGGTLTADSTTTTPGVGQAEFFGYNCYESALRFDTSAVGAGATVTSATLSVYGQADTDSTNFTGNARVSNWGPTLTTADWVSGASLSGLTLVATFAMAGWSTAGYNDFADVALPANVSTSGFTELNLSSSRHEAGTTPGTGTFESVNFFSADQAGTTNDPKLVVVTTSNITPPLPVVVDTAVSRASNY